MKTRYKWKKRRRRQHRQESTIPSNYRQVVLSSTLYFLLAFALDGLPELGSSFKEIFLVALFEKNPKLIIFHSMLHLDFRGLLENLFRLHIWIPDEISFCLIGRTIYFWIKIKFSISKPPLQKVTVAKKLKIWSLLKNI